MGLHPDDPRATEVVALTVEADGLEAEADQLATLARAKRAEAAKLRSKAERIEAGASVPMRRPITALERVRNDGLLAAAGLATEDLRAGFVARDLAGQLGIADVRRAERLLAALEELGKVARYGEGFMTVDPDETAVRDYVVATREFAMGDAVQALGLSELELDDYLRRLQERGVVEGQGGFWRYVEAGPERATTRRRRMRPPEAVVGGDLAPARGEAVPHTRAMGTTGKPGADKKRAAQGWKIKRDRQGT